MAFGVGIMKACSEWFRKLTGRHVARTISAGSDAPGLAKLLGSSLLTPGAHSRIQTTQLQASVIGVYFSAHWCPPCRRFTPILATVYNEAKRQNKSFEVVFCSQDSDLASFVSYFSSMPWHAVPYENRAQCQMLGNMWGVRGIPTLVLVNGQGGIIQKDRVVQLVSSSAETFIRSLPMARRPTAVSDESYVEMPPEPIVENLDELMEAIQNDKAMTDLDRVTGYKTILSLTQNIVENPDVQKYRVLNKDNSNIKTKITRFPNLVKLLKYAGFGETTTKYVFPADRKVQDSRLDEVYQVVSCLTMSIDEVAETEPKEHAGWICEDGVCRREDDK